MKSSTRSVFKLFLRQHTFAPMMSKPGGLKLFTLSLGFAVAGLSIPSAQAGSATWTGATNNLLNTTTNWTAGGPPNISGDTATWDGTQPGNLTLDWGGGFGVSTAGTNLNVLGTNTGSLTLYTTAISASPNTLTNFLSVGNITIASGAGAFTIGDGTSNFNNMVLRNPGNTAANTFTNNSSNTATIASNVGMNSGGGTGGRPITFDGSGNWQVNAALSLGGNGSLKIIKNGTGTLTLTNAQAAIGTSVYSGAYTVNAGTLAVTGSGKLSGSGTGTASLAGGTLDLGTTSQTMGAITISAAAASGSTITNGSLTATSLTATNTSGNVVVSASMLGTGTVSKNGAGGMLTLSGANTYSGGTTISAGELRVDSTGGTGTGAVNETGGVLSGTGSASGLVTITGGVVAAGDNASNNTGSVGTLGVGTTGGAALTNAALVYDLSSTFGGANDLLTTGGALNLGTVTFTFSEIGGALDTSNPYTLFTSANGISGFTGGYATTFLGGSNYTPIYSVVGNNLEVTFTAAPEPSQWASIGLGILGLGGLALKARKRRSTIIAS